MLKIQEHEQEVIQMRKYLSEFSIKVTKEPVFLIHQFCFVILLYKGMIFIFGRKHKFATRNLFWKSGLLICAW